MANLILEGERLDEKEIIEIAKKLQDFKKTEIYKIINAFNQNAIKELLSANKDINESSDHRLGKMEGIQEAFENRILLTIKEAENMIATKKMEKELGIKEEE